ncbi:MAG: hypothetical protein RLZZ350_1599 [Verrucomicrobiota bacterium]|jgi:hypothetical protein
MTKRDPIVVFLLCIFTCGIYPIYWLVQTKIEMKNLGADIPTAWLLIIPFANIYWLWCWAKGVELVTKGKWGAVPAFLLVVFIAWLGIPLTQSEFNKSAAS